jgi:hypothetical protein
MDLREIGWCDVEWIGLAQGMDMLRALVTAVMNLQVPCNVGKLSDEWLHNRWPFE